MRTRRISGLLKMFVKVVAKLIFKGTVCLFVLRFYSQVNPMGSCRAQSVLPNHMFTAQAYSFKQLTSIVHILSPETDNLLREK